MTSLKLASSVLTFLVMMCFTCTSCGGGGALEEAAPVGRLSMYL
jgi:hypothetical protein